MKIAILLFMVSAGVFAWIYYQREFVVPKMTPTPATEVPGNVSAAYFAGGCFWCTEADFEKVAGVREVISGYAGGHIAHPSYEDVAGGASGHRETVEVRYDPRVVSYRMLVEYFFSRIDPVDPGGQFIDRGESYTSAIFYKSSEEEALIRDVIRELEEKNVYGAKIVTLVAPFTNFYPAEEYHQDYHKKNPLRYSYYRSGSKRDTRLGELCALREAKGFTCEIPTTGTTPPGTSSAHWRTFKKPSKEELKKILSPISFKVTQEGGTERAFDNAYWNSREKGVYVDIVSGEPLFSSRDKFDSGTGWPSFTKPISEDAVILKEDNALFVSRTEVRSRIADSHIGHVFDDVQETWKEKGGPPAGAKRYCMNSAALRFIPMEQMEKEGYGEYLKSI